jgi:hypothetical protein
MPYVTSVERIRIEKGRKETLMEVLAEDVEAKFPRDVAEIMTKVKDLKGGDALRAARKVLKNVQSADEFRAAIADIAKANEPS